MIYLVQNVSQASFTSLNRAELVILLLTIPERQIIQDNKDEYSKVVEIN